jgi:heterogeneous nuclear rnp K-like protein 2
MQALKLITDTLVQDPPRWTCKLLVAHQLAGSIIGKQGSRIKAIQEQSGAKIVISKDLLPQSTERVVEVTGTDKELY